MRPLRLAGNGRPNTPANAKPRRRSRPRLCGGHMQVAMHVPPVRVEVEAASREAVALSLSPEGFAEGFIRRQYASRA